MTFIPQACNEWCWAAGVTMIAAYFGISTSECGLASAYSDFSYDCCVPDACSYSQCNHGSGPVVYIDRAFQYVGLHGYANHTSGSPPAIDELTAAGELAAGRPVLLGFTGPFISHVAVLTGYQTVGGVRNFHVMDPWYGEVDRPFASLAYGGPDGSSQISDAWSQFHK